MALMKYSAKIKLYNSYFDLNNNLTAKSILSLFQDAASIHAEEIGVGFDAMLQKKLYWVLSRVKFDILKMPKPNELIIIETWPHQKGRIDFDRDMRILSETGELLIIGTSKWCLIDTEKRSLQKADSINYNGEIFDLINYNDKFLKITLPDSLFESQFSHVVRFCDLDQNMHMNNTHYATLVSNAIADKSFSHFEINYLNECLLNDKIEVMTTKNSDGEFVKGVAGEKTAFIAFIKK